MAKKLLIKKPRSTIVDGRKVLLSKFEKHMVDDERDFHSKFGIVKKSELQKSIASVGKEEFYVLNPSFIDDYKRLKRLAQVITLKDIGAIITTTGINRDSIVMEAGTGSAGLSCYLAHICKRIISYDIKAEHQKVAKENIDSLGIKNIELKDGDIFKPETIEETDVDVLVLDVTEPWNAIITAEKVLKVGGFVVSYSPNISQTHLFVNALNENFLYERTVEIIEREWTVKDKVLRPRMKDLGHTAFLSFARRIQ
jgi:tRNA (adenine57-N1/adenine58-N1)-methyltransferase catalytic subunit